MDRILRGTAATISVTLQVGREATDPTPDEATLEIVADDGTEIVPAGTDATDDPDDAGKFNYVVTPDKTDRLDVWTVRWTAALGGVEQTVETHVEIVGGFLFSLADLANQFKEERRAEYTDEQLADARTLAEQAFENEARLGFVPRYHSETIDGPSGAVAALSRGPVRTVRSVETRRAFTDTWDDLPAGSFEASRSGVRRSGYWEPGVQNVRVRYEYGLDRPPAEVSNAVLILAKTWLASGPNTSRELSRYLEDQGVSIGLAVPGVRGFTFGMPEVDSVLEGYRVPLIG